MTTEVTSRVALAGFRRILGADAVLTDHEAMAPCLTDHRKLYEGAALAVLRPGSVEEVAQLLAFCNGTRIGVVPQGGNTGYCGGATPDESGRQVVLSLARLAHVRRIDPANYSLVAEAGCILASMIVMWFSRQREFRADAGGAHLAGTANMIGALERLKAAHPQPLPSQMAAFGIAGGPGAGLKRLFMSHPPLDERIAALRNARL